MGGKGGNNAQKGRRKRKTQQHRNMRTKCGIADPPRFEFAEEFRDWVLDLVAAAWRLPVH